MKEINGRTYSLWQQLLDQEERWVGGMLIDKTEVGEWMYTKITAVILEPNGETSALFGFRGEDFNCTFDVAYGGVLGVPGPGITFGTRYSTFTAMKKKEWEDAKSREEHRGYNK